ncbi:hypothetical protein N7373_17610 [Achromobacter mucicolens]|uniref:hypothetical protein n=1 Tax=Achromobacter mucicolens TaxID=1389922 RepID=UPI002446C177|nr:hypothetical protein [Achromobacter mucicolens]MDH0093273.1 hypothetical protein [Achromobacter mucicolens]
MARPHLALCLLIEQMLGDFDGTGRSSAGDTFDIFMRTALFELANTDAAIKDSPARAAVHAQIEAVTKNLPEEDAGVLPWLLGQSRSHLIELLALRHCSWRRSMPSRRSLHLR